MSSEHVGEDRLVELALGTLEQHDEAEALGHLDACPGCRAAYDDVAATVDSVLPAAPTVAPPAGFDARVLDRLALRSPQQTRPARRSRRWVLAAAAAAVVGAGAGVAGATVLGRSEDPEVTARGARLRTAAGAAVGTVEPTRLSGREVLVMQVAGAPVGVRYTCRLDLDDGSSRDAGSWSVPASGSAVWLAPTAGDPVRSVALVTDSGKVWATARLPA